MERLRIHDNGRLDSLIAVGSALDLLPELLTGCAAVCVVFDRNTKVWADHLTPWLQKCRGMRFEIAPGEEQKDLRTLEQLYRSMADFNLTRDSIVVAVGGGVVTDLAGYAAASFLRGIPWIAIPTSLLAQVDAAVGGKTGINLLEGKNLVGAFHLPRGVLVEPQALKSLPMREWRSGIGEIVKSALIAQGPLWEWLTAEEIPRLGTAEDPFWENVIAETIRIKVDVVNRDPRESGDRMFLNFGHTLGHALEQMLGYGTLSHGEAVGIGSLVALVLSERKTGLNPGVRHQVARWLKHWDMPQRVPTLDPSRLEAVLGRDKKARGSGLQWVLLESVGRPIISGGIDMGEVLQAIARVNQDAED